LNGFSAFFSPFGKEDSGMKLLKLLMVVSLCVPLSMAGCAKKEEKAEPAKPSEGAVTKKETVVKVPEKIKGKWRAVTLSLKDAKSGKLGTFPVEIGSALAVPGTDFSVKVINFFPHFVMEGINLTSKSNEVKNPAAEIRIYQKDKEIYHGWVFANYPTANIPEVFTFEIGLVGATPAE
jgi:hypothetical protein